MTETTKKADDATKDNMIQGSGSQSKIMLDFEKLREAGWTIQQVKRESSSGAKICLHNTNPCGNTLKSAKDAEQQLSDEEVLHTFSTTQGNVNAKHAQKSATDLSHNASDYEPPQKELPKQRNVEWQDFMLF